MSQTIFYGPKDVQAIEVRLYANGSEPECLLHMQIAVGQSVLYICKWQWSRMPYANDRQPEYLIHMQMFLAKEF